MQERVGPPGILEVSVHEGVKYALKEKQEPLLEVLQVLLLYQGSSVLSLSDLK